MLNLSDYDYKLPADLIAQEPVRERDNSRLLVLERKTGKVSHKCFFDITEYLSPGDCLVLNRTKVIPARMFGRKETGGKVEVFFLDAIGRKALENRYKVLLKPLLRPESKIILPGNLIATVEGRASENETIISINSNDLEAVLKKYGHMPLPNYIKRTADPTSSIAESDRKRYQTVYASEEGSIAAPTAGLHFTPGLLENIRKKGIKIVEIVLHVGWGTFKPIISNDVSAHRMMSECYEINDSTAGLINECRSNNGRIVAVGTTTVRALESAPADSEGIVSGKGETSIFIYPGYKFRFVDTMVTNFHQPASTPLLMSCAFAGRENILAAYDQAINEKYRFFSYGDAMIII